MAEELPDTSTARNGFIWLALTLIIIVLDQWSKWLVTGHLERGDVIELIPGFFNLVLTYNPGAAFSFLSDAGGWQRWFFTVVTLVISTALLFILKKSAASNWQECLPVSAILGGAAGNLLDRLRLGEVVDFLDFYYLGWHWPAFNVADSAISVGAISWIVLSFFSGEKQ